MDDFDISFDFGASGQQEEDFPVYSKPEPPRKPVNNLEFSKARDFN